MLEELTAGYLETQFRKLHIGVNETIQLIKLYLNLGTWDYKLSLNIIILMPETDSSRVVSCNQVTETSSTEFC